MKKTQKVLEALKFIDSLNMSQLELERLASEVESMVDEEYVDQTDLDEDKDLSLKWLNNGN